MLETTAVPFYSFSNDSSHLALVKNEIIQQWLSGCNDDVVHMRWMPLAGKIWAMPPFLPVIDDILALPYEIEECSTTHLSI